MTTGPCCDTTEFVAEFHDAKACGATSVGITVLDKSGNSAVRRLPLK